MSRILRILGKRGKITVPLEIRRNIGFAAGDILSFTETDDGKAVTVKKEKICDRCKEITDTCQDDSIALLDFLNSLSDEQQRAAALHLMAKWVKEQEKGEKTDA